MKRTFAAGLVGAVAAIAILASAVPARATLDMQKKAKEAGIAATNCLYCHNEKLPKKGAVTNNERGKWLVDHKEAKKAKEVDATWLKDYVEKK